MLDAADYCWLLLLIVAGWYLVLVHVVGSWCWLLLTAAGCTILAITGGWWMLLVAADGYWIQMSTTSYYCFLLATVADGVASHCWLQLLGAPKCC